jgi:glycosyltransferase involved in cell wall biosynthesis
MTYLALFILAFSVIQLLIAVSNILFGQLRMKGKTVDDVLVSVLIPVRNEEKNISNILSDLKEQDYQNIEIIVFDDLSTDKTAQIVDWHSNADCRIQLVRSDGLPNGWLGKNHACSVMAGHAKGNCFLFLDADVRIDKMAISQTVSYLKRHKLGLLSVFPNQLMYSPGEWKTVPTMNHILLSLLPLALVRKSNFTSLSAANGQFMLFDALTYSKNQLHEKFKGNKVEDISIARFLKKKKVRIACLAANKSIKCRMYESYSDAVNGFSKNVVHFFGNSFVLALLYWTLSSFGFIIIVLTLDLNLILLYFGAIISTRIITSLTSQQSVPKNLLYFIPQQLAIGLFIYRALKSKITNQYEWKGRNISY